MGKACARALQRRTRLLAGPHEERRQAQLIGWHAVAALQQRQLHRRADQRQVAPAPQAGLASGLGGGFGSRVSPLLAPQAGYYFGFGVPGAAGGPGVRLLVTLRWCLASRCFHVAQVTFT